MSETSLKNNIVMKIPSIARNYLNKIKCLVNFSLQILNVIRKYHLHPERLVVREITGKISLTAHRRLCIFAHYDKDASISPNVLHYLEELAKSNCTIIFVSACSKMRESETNKILNLCAKIILKKNIGMDFGSWRIGLHTIQNLSYYHQIIFANDSVYGPLFNLAEVFNKMATENLDLWGITESWQHAYHLQSYFLVVNSSAFHHEFFKKFWQSFRFITNKEKVIKNYEIGFTQEALQHQLSVGSYCKYFDVYATKKAQYLNEPYKNYFYCIIKNGLAMNPTHMCWDILISHFHCPFLKKELLCDNPTQIPNIAEWPYIIKKYTHYEVSLIHEHLQKVLDNKIINSV